MTDWIQKKLDTDTTLTADQRNTLRSMLKNGTLEQQNEAYWDRYVANEERPHNNNILDQE